MSFEESVTHWLQAIQKGDRGPARLLWSRYFQRITSLARSNLGSARCGAADEEDVAISAFDSFFQGIENGDFPRMQDRDDLWRILVVITLRKAVNVVKYECRQKRGGSVVHETDDEILQSLICREPDPAVLVATDEECLRLLDLLGDDELRRVVALKLAGHTNIEVAKMIGCSRVTVQRMLSLIRQTWQQELAQ